MINIRKISVVALAMVAMVVNAQDTNLNKEIVVEKDFKPTETEANKLNISPNQVEITIDDKELDYSNWAVPTTVSPTIQTLSPIEYEGKQLTSTQRGYLKVGVGTYLNSSSAIGYRAIDTEKSKLNLWGVHTSTWLGENNSPYITDDNGDTPTQKFNDGVLGVSFSQLLKGNHIFNADAYYHFDRFNYYGSLLDLENQSVNEFNIALSLDKRESVGALNYRGDLEYNYWGNSYEFYQPTSEGVVENQFKISAAAEKIIPSIGNIELELDANYIFYNQDLPTAENLDVQESNIFIIGLTPAYKYKSNKLALQLGVNLDYSVASEGKFSISPAIKLDYQFNNSVGAYAYILGGSKANSFAELSAKNRYFNPSLLYGVSDSPFDANLGIKFLPLEGFKGEISAGYAIINNQMLPYYSTLQAATIYNGLDMKGWYVAADFEYSYKTIGSAKIGVKYAPQDDIDSGYAFNDDRAELILNAEFTITPIDKLSATLGYEYRYNRSVWGVDTDMQVVSADLGNINNLYLKATYNMTDKFNIFANIDNMLFQQWDNYYGMGAQKFGAVAGISILF